jgi:hypothetical protein
MCAGSITMSWPPLPGPLPHGGEGTGGVATPRGGPAGRLFEGRAALRGDAEARARVAGVCGRGCRGEASPSRDPHDEPDPADAANPGDDMIDGDASPLPRRPGSLAACGPPGSLRSASIRGIFVLHLYRLSKSGAMVQSVWDALPGQYPGVDVDTFVLMPNHVHGIIVLAGDHVGATPRGCPDDAAVDGVDGQARGGRSIRWQGACCVTICRST